MNKKTVVLLTTILLTFIFTVGTFIGCGVQGIKQTADTDTKTTETADELATVSAQAYLSDMNQGLSASPYAFIPAAMIPEYEENFVSESEITYDFSDFVNVSAIKYGGFGKQWNMVIDNIRQSTYFYKYLNTGNTVISTALTVIGEYLAAKNVVDANKVIEKNNFSVSISYQNKIFDCSIIYKTNINNSKFGNISPTVSMAYNTVSGEKIYSIRFSDTNRMRYTVSENKYEFGIEYGISTELRTSYLIIERKNNGVEGHIYEYLTLKDKDLVPSCADFYIDDTYVSVVGNKADAMMVAKGYINELYKKNEGKLLGYEVRETISNFDYNTLWFNLNDISGITSIKIGDNTNANESSKSTNDVYLNGSDTLFSPTYNTKTVMFVTTKTSRKYDIEFRTQYFYGKDAETGEIIEYAVKVPMMFIQEDNDKDSNFTDYPANILADNGITSTVTINQTYLDKIMSDYDTLIDDFIENKQMMSSAEIKAYVES